MSIDLFLAQNQSFETERLLLRKITLADAQAIFEYASDEETARFVSFEPYENLDRTKEGIAGFFMKDPLAKFGIVEKASGKLIGTIDFRISGDKMAEFGWCLNKTHCT